MTVTVNAREPQGEKKEGTALEVSNSDDRVQTIPDYYECTENDINDAATRGRNLSQRKEGTGENELKKRKR